MYRSKRADRKYLLDKLKIAAIFFMLVLVGGVVALGQNWTSGEIIPTYVNESGASLLENAEFVDLAQDSYEVAHGYDILFDLDGFTDAPMVSGVSETITDGTERIDFFANRIPLGDFDRPPMIALTFDDGPSSLTSDLLDILDEHGGQVTFCLIGDLIENGAATVVRAFNSGHEIIGHSWDHQDFGRLNAEQITEQIERTSALIEAVTGEPSPPLYRVPYGRMNDNIFDVSSELGYGILHWSIDPRDWRVRDENYVYNYVTEHAVDGAIIVLHDIHPTTIEAMKRVIPELIEQGYELVSATEIIYHVYGTLEPGFEHRGLRR
ncbi:MAG: polysaccharide deacetylase family protein [Clostridiales bacterium]|jgi:peptidoglycan/xylan/chitin deacetylase (PgdA/CDA1 family)|nr:polysaccharide deacetylase family protein [Clostridiales bacterium]